MIQRMSHVPIFVLDQEEAKDFYVNKLGFELHTDVDMGDGMKWITVNVPGQKELEIILMGTTASPANSAMARTPQTMPLIASLRGATTAVFCTGPSPVTSVLV